MRLLRASCRAVGLVVILLLGAALRVAGKLLLGWSPARDRAWRRRAFRATTRALVRLIGLRATVLGVPPRRPFLLVSNHVSYVDIILLASQLDAVFVAKHDVRGWPLIGWVTRCFDTVYIDRTRRADVPRVNRQLEQVLDRGDGIVLFPEGTSTAGDQVLPLKPGAMAVAAKRGLPVHYAGIAYRTAAGDPPAATAVCWWGDMEFIGHLWGLFGLRTFTAALAFGPQPILDPDRKELARRLREAIGAQRATATEELKKEHADTSVGQSDYRLSSASR